MVKMDKSSYGLSIFIESNIYILSISYSSCLILRIKTKLTAPIRFCAGSIDEEHEMLLTISYKPKGLVIVRTRANSEVNSVRDRVNQVSPVCLAKLQEKVSFVNCSS